MESQSKFHGSSHQLTNPPIFYPHAHTQNSARASFVRLFVDSPRWFAIQKTDWDFAMQAVAHSHDGSMVLA